MLLTGAGDLVWRHHVREAKVPPNHRLEHLVSLWLISLISLSCASCALQLEDKGVRFRSSLSMMQKLRRFFHADASPGCIARFSSSAAFTLIELLVVIAIIAILAG